MNTQERQRLCCSKEMVKGYDTEARVYPLLFFSFTYIYHLFSLKHKLQEGKGLSVLFKAGLPVSRIIPSTSEVHSGCSLTITET